VHFILYKSAAAPNHFISALSLRVPWMCYVAQLSEPSPSKGSTAILMYCFTRSRVSTQHPVQRFWILDILGTFQNLTCRKKYGQTFYRPINTFREQSTGADTDCSIARSCVNPPFFSRTVLRLRIYHCSPAFQHALTSICTMLV
jgi:hypothetical protein